MDKTDIKCRYKKEGGQKHNCKRTQTQTQSGLLDPGSVHCKIYSIHEANDPENMAYVRAVHAGVKACVCVCVSVELNLFKVIYM